MHEKLEKYLEQLTIEKKEYRFPNFCSQYSNAIDNKNYLAIHQDPGHSSPEKITGECSILNPDPTAEKLREVLNQEGISYDEVLFWNFFPFFKFKGRKITDEEKEFWSEKLNDLIDILPNVKILIVSGREAWLGMRFFRPRKAIPFLASPHPSRRGMLQKTAPKRLKSAWKLAKQRVDSSIIG